jgi:hypothetical protein
LSNNLFIECNQCLIECNQCLIECNHCHNLATTTARLWVDIHMHTAHSPPTLHHGQHYGHIASIAPPPPPLTSGAVVRQRPA